MSRIWCPILAGLFLWVGAVRGESGWGAEVEALLASPDGGARAVARLESLPLAERQTRAYHRALARAFQSDAKPGPAAEAVAVHDLLPPAGDDDVPAVRKWIATKAVEEYLAALAAQKKGDTAGAAKSYLRALMMDPAIQGRDDAGLRDISSRSLDAAVKKKPDEAGLRFKHALCAYRAGRLGEAQASFDAYLKIEKSPYPAWRGGLWLAHVKAERSAMAAQDEKSAQADAVRRAREAAEEAAAAAKAARAVSTVPAAVPANPDVPPEIAEKRKAIQSEIDKIDIAIAGAGNADAIKDAAGAYGKKYGKLIDRFVNSPVAQSKLADLQARRAALEEELRSLR